MLVRVYVCVYVCTRIKAKLAADRLVLASAHAVILWQPPCTACSLVRATLAALWRCCRCGCCCCNDLSLRLHLRASTRGRPTCTSVASIAQRWRTRRARINTHAHLHTHARARTTNRRVRRAAKAIFHTYRAIYIYIYATIIIYEGIMLFRVSARQSVLCGLHFEHYNYARSRDVAGFSIH